jgi:hypothetical protein
MKNIPLMNLEFIKLAKAMRAAQEEGRSLPNSTRAAHAQRRARSLEQIFDSRIEAYERQINEELKEIEQRAKQGDPA